MFLITLWFFLQNMPLSFSPSPLLGFFFETTILIKTSSCYVSLALFITMKIKSKMCSKFVQFVSVCISLYQFVQKVQKNYKPCLTLYRYHLLSPELNTSELDTRLNFIILLLLILDIAKYTSNHLFISVI